MNLTVNGTIVSDDDRWLYEYFGFSCFSPSAVRNALSNNPRNEELVLEVNSVGGSVFAGFEIYSLLRQAACPTRAVVQSLAASAASTIVSACQTVQMSPVAQIMIHNPSMSTDGNQDAHKASIKLLDAITQSILNGYEVKVKGKTTRDKLTQLMRSETWLPAQEAVKLGLADEILELDDVEIPSTVVNAVGDSIRGIFNSSNIPTAGELRARYEHDVRAGLKEAAPGHPVNAAKLKSEEEKTEESEEESEEETEEETDDNDEDANEDDADEEENEESEEEEEDPEKKKKTGAADNKIWSMRLRLVAENLKFEGVY
jgi:ATP-dependent Clp protease, protease subunit